MARHLFLLALLKQFICSSNLIKVKRIRFTYSFGCFFIGYIGQKCESICDKWNPCKNGASCKLSHSSTDGYVCQCTPGHSGQYCEKSMDQPCPATWWGKPICGPCNCPDDKGYDPICNKTSGQCNCKENHYKPPGSDTCNPCNCYSIGSYRMSCDAVTGQCPCRSGVIGRRCDGCSSRFAEVTLRGCEGNLHL